MINYGVEKREGLATLNILTEVFVFSTRNRQMAGSITGVFELIFDNCIISHIQNSTNVEARRVFLNNDLYVSKSELRAFIVLLCVRIKYRGKIFLWTSSKVRHWVYLFSWKPWQEIVTEK